MGMKGATSADMELLRLSLPLWLGVETPAKYEMMVTPNIENEHRGAVELFQMGLAGSRRCQSCWLTVFKTVGEAIVVQI